MQEVEAMCDRVLVINKGELVADQSIQESNDSINYLVSFNNAINEESLKLLKNIKSIIKKQEQTFEISFLKENFNPTSVFDFAVENNLKITQLTEIETDIEKLFKEVTV